MSDFKLIINNTENVAASVINNESQNAVRVGKNISANKASGVTTQYNTVENISDANVRLNRISSVYMDGIAPDFHNKNVIIHICNSAWQGEGQWSAFTPYEIGLYPVAEHDFSHIDKTFSSVGSWSTHKYYPLLIIEDKTDRKAWFFELEAGSGWSFELGTARKEGVCCLTVDCTACNENHDGFYKISRPKESFNTPTVLYGTAKNFDDAVIRLLKYKRATARRFESVPVCFNDYMNCLWAMPERERLIPLIDAAAEVGAEVFCIDDGWFHRTGERVGFGDWIENDEPFGKDGLKGILDYIASKGMKPGLWFELETAFSNAAITTIAPDALLTRDGLAIGSERQMLNLRCRKVTDYLHERIKYFYDLGLRYIKNDYNHSTGIGCDGENESFSAALIDNTLAFYEFIEGLYADMPELIIENCGSGAMRCDNGTLKHFHLQSTSDQEIFTNNPSIIYGLQRCMLPEKSGIWCFPFPAPYCNRLDTDATFTDEYLAEMSDGEQTVYNMCCGFFGIVTLSGHIEKCDAYNLSLIKKAIDTYKKDRDFISSSLPVFLGKQQKLYSEGYSILALENGKKLRIGIFRNGTKDTVRFKLPKRYANGTLNEIYPLKDDSRTAFIDKNYFCFKTDKKLCAAVYEINL